MRTLHNNELNHISGSGVDSSILDGLGTAIAAVFVLAIATTAVTAGAITYYFTSQKEPAADPTRTVQ